MIRTSASFLVLTLAVSLQGCIYITEAEWEAFNDRDQDGLDFGVDCDDSNCASSALCKPEICDNEIDDDEDGDVDCADAECVDQPACKGDGVKQVPAWTADGGQGGARLGWSVSTAGDITGDGFDDVILGAPGLSNPEAGEGVALVYYGIGTGLTPTPVWIGEIDQPGAAFGSSVRNAGDVNGDGLSDVIVGAPLYTNGQMNEGAAFVFQATPGGLFGVPSWSAGALIGTSSR